jgi:hypothetical protein
MTTYTIQTPKNIYNTWYKPETVDTIRIDSSLSDEERRKIFAYLTMLSEMGDHPLNVEFDYIMGDIQTIYSHHKVFINKMVLDDYTLYILDSEKERINLERSIKIKKIL